LNGHICPIPFISHECGEGPCPPNAIDRHWGDL
jgi:hypothetical protein